MSLTKFEMDGFHKFQEWNRKNNVDTTNDFNKMRDHVLNAESVELSVALYIFLSKTLGSQDEIKQDEYIPKMFSLISEANNKFPEFYGWVKQIYEKHKVGILPLGHE